jgi:NAD(P)-dependent dehydrogenase (short-subunit alcohol dehydrogenase family)
MARVAIITGAASGIGLALASALAGRGDTVVVADIDGEGAERAAHAIGRDTIGAASAAVVDVSDAAAVQALVHGTNDRHGRVDVMVNNAGIAIGGEARDMLLEHWNRSIDVNLRGVVHGVHAAYPIMVEQRSGHIVNTASLAGLVPGGLMAPYAMTKHAVVGLSLSLRVEAADYGVRVTAVCPGVVETPILDSSGPDDLPKPALSGHTREYFRHLVPRFYPAEKMAQDILRGMDRNTALIVSPGAARLLWRLWRYTPVVANRISARQLAWARATFAAERTGTSSETWHSEHP